MIKTTLNLKNSDNIEGILKEIVETSYNNIKNEVVLLSITQHDIDIYTATADNDEFNDAIKENFILDENEDIDDPETYSQLMDELQAYFIALHKESGLFDYFSAGSYEINREKKTQKGEYLAPKGIFYAPFYEAVIKRH